MRTAKKPQRTKASSKMGPTRASSGELASTLGDHRTGVIESHHHAPGGHGPDADGSEVVDAAGDLHSDDRDVDDSESEVDAAVERKAEIPDIENVGRLADENVEESERSFLDEPAAEPDATEARRVQRRRSA